MSYEPAGLPYTLRQKGAKRELSHAKRCKLRDVGMRVQLSSFIGTFKVQSI